MTHQLAMFDLTDPRSPAKIDVHEVGFEVEDVDVFQTEGTDGLVVAVADGNLSGTVTIVREAETSSPRLTRVALDGEDLPFQANPARGKTKRVAVGRDGVVYATVRDEETKTECLVSIGVDGVPATIFDIDPELDIHRIEVADFDSDGTQEVVVDVLSSDAPGGGFQYVFWSEGFK